MSEWRAYELGIADIVRHKVGSAAIVEHDVRLRGRSGQLRQIDIAVRGSIFGLSEALFVVECKNHRRPIDVGVVDAFVGLVEDVDADLGLLVSATGVTATAQSRAAEKRLRVRLVPRSDLDQWAPPGTRSLVLMVPSPGAETARNALVDAGYRVRTKASHDDETHIEAFRLADPSDAAGFSERAVQTLHDVGIQARSTGSGVTVAGGTPRHRWIPVYVGASPMPFRVPAADQPELDQLLIQLAQDLGVCVSDLVAKPPDGWPFADTF
jgi:hypothetical protein